MKTKIKKAQVEQFIGIALIVMAIVGFVVFSKVFSAKKIASQTIESSMSYRQSGALLTISTVPYMTAQGFPLDQLWGVYTCYGEDTADYGSIKINITSETNKKMNILFGSGNWKIELKGKNDIVLGNPNISGSNIFVYDFLYSIPCNMSVIGRGKIYVR